jgi:NADH:ubiquinone oxidoreductase subunit K
MIVIGVVVVIAAIIFALVFLYNQGAETTGQVRDIFIIFMAFESLIIGAALIILIVQLALLTNLLQNEIKPIIDSTNETVNTVRGTATFLSDNLAEPVIKLNEYLAYLKKVTDLLNIGKK